MKKFISLFMTMVMCFAFAMPVLAMDTASEETAPVTRERAIEILGVTEEEVEGLELMPMPSATTETSQMGRSTIPSELPPGMYYEEISLGSFTGALHTIKGPSFKWSFTIGEMNVSPVSNWVVGVSMFFTNKYRGGDGCYYFNEDSSKSYTSQIFKNTNGEQIYFRYWFNNQHEGDRGKALVIVLVYNNPQ